MLLLNLTLIMHRQPGILTSHTQKNKIQITQNKCIQYCLQQEKMTHISKNELETQLVTC